MRKFLLALLLVVSTSSYAEMNDNEKMAYNWYGYHDISVYYMNDDGLIIKDRQIAYKEKENE